MKKLLAIVLVLSLAVVMLACGNTTEPTGETAGETTAATTEKATEKTTKATEPATEPEETEPEETTTEEPAVELEPYTDATVVYLASDGKGNGSAPDQATDTLSKALDCLDLSKDCTVVVSGYYLQDEAFVYTETFDGSVTITSVYDGVDYREKGAEYQPMAVRFVCSGEYVFRDLKLNLLGDFFFVIANHYPITVDTGVSVSSLSMNFDGSSFAKAFGILGGYQNGQPVIVDGEQPPVETDAPVSITVKSGINFSIGAYSRQVDGAVNTGESVINIGGDAVVTRLYLAPCNKPYTCGNVTVNVTDNANVTNIYGATSVGTADGATINWMGGTIGMYADILQEGYEYNATNGVHLVHSEAAKADPNFEAVCAEFDSVTQQ